MDLVAELPTDVDDEHRSRHRANLAHATAAWEAISVDDIIAFYSRRVEKP
jgi:hypothetical protein